MRSPLSAFQVVALEGIVLFGVPNHHFNRTASFEQTFERPSGSAYACHQ